MTNYTLTTATGALAISGNNASLLEAHHLNAATGSLGIAGNTADRLRVYAPVQTDLVTTSEVVNVGVPVDLSNIVTITPTLTPLYRAVATVQEHIQLALSHSETAYYTQAWLDTITLRALAQVGMPVDLADTMTLSSAMQTAYAVTVLDRLNLQSVTAAQGKYGLTLLDIVTLNDGLWRFISAVISDTVSLTPTLTPTYCATASVLDAVVLSEALSGQLLVQVTLADTLDLTDAQLIKAIFSEELTDDLTISFGYVSPDGNFTAWAINTRTNAVTEYANFEFNSFARMGRKYIAASRDGIFELDGVDDDGVSIDAYIRSGLFAPGGSRLSAFKAAYLGLRVNDGGQDIYLKLTTGDDLERVYRVRANDMNTTRVDFGKGLRSRWWAWELEVAGADFDLDSVTFIPLVASRRVG